MDTVTLRARTAAAAPARSAGLARTVKPCRLIVRSGMVGTKTVSDIQITKKGATDSLEVRPWSSSCVLCGPLLARVCTALARGQKFYESMVQIT